MKLKYGMKFENASKKFKKIEKNPYFIWW